MNYEPLFENLLPEGKYSYKIMNAFEFNSKNKGTPMLRLGLSIYNDKGNRTNLDYSIPLTGSFLRSVAKSVGELELYESKKMECHHLTGKTGLCVIEIEENAIYEKRNSVKKMIPKSTEGIKEDKVQDNDIPF